jgi:hypothetical protein
VWVAPRVGDVGLVRAGESSRNEGRTSFVLSPTLGPWRQSIRMAEALTAQVHHIPVSSHRWFGVVSTLLS